MKEREYLLKYKDNIKEENKNRLRRSNIKALTYILKTSINLFLFIITIVIIIITILVKPYLF